MTSKNPWFVKPDVSRINLKWNDPDGHTHPLWIEVKTELTIGEERSILRSVSNVTAEVQQKTATAPRQDPSANFDWTEYSFARMLTYLLDWSLADENNNKLAINRDVLGSFHKTLFDLLDDAVEQHISAGGETKKQKGTKRKR